MHLGYRVRRRKKGEEKGCEMHEVKIKYKTFHNQNGEVNQLIELMIFVQIFRKNVYIDI